MAGICFAIISDIFAKLFMKNRLCYGDTVKVCFIHIIIQMLVLNEIDFTFRILFLGEDVLTPFVLIERTFPSSLLVPHTQITEKS